MADTDIIVSEMTPASQINTGDLMIMTQPDAQAETGYSTKSATVLQVANKQLKGIDFPTDLPSFDDPNVLGGLEELKADIKALLPVSSAVGNPCTFETNIADNLVSLTANITASGGNGTPSTPIPIVGHSELNLTRCGKNLCYVGDSSLFPTGDNLPIGVNTATHTAYVKCLPNTTVYFKKANATNRTFFYGCNELPAVGVIVHSLSYTEISPNEYSVNSGSYTYIAFYYSNESDENIMACYNQSDLTAYEPYNGQTFTIPFGQTVYGGVYDANRGKVRITHTLEYLKDKDWNNYVASGQQIFRCKAETNKPAASRSDITCDRFVLVAPTGNPMTSGQMRNYYFNVYNLEFYVDTITTMTDWTNFITTNNVAIKVPLATPIEIDVSELSVDTIVGVNNIVSDCGGDVEVQYRDSIQHYIDKKIAETQALIL